MKLEITIQSISKDIGMGNDARLFKCDQSIVPEGFENVGCFRGASRNLLTFEFHQKIGHYYRLVWYIKLIQNGYKAHLREFGIKWKWRGQGFTAFDGVLLVNQLKALRCLSVYLSITPTKSESWQSEILLISI